MTLTERDFENLTLRELSKKDPDALIDMVQKLSEREAETLMYAWEEWARPEQLISDYIEPGIRWNVFLVLSGRGFGKGLDINTALPTPSGWTTMGEVQIGDQVLDEKGKSCSITGKFRSSGQAYRVIFSDGQELIADSPHQWVTWTHRDRKQYLRYGQKTDFPDDWPSWEGNIFDSHGNIKGNYGPKIRTTEEIRLTLQQDTKRQGLNHCIPIAKPLDLPEKKLEIDPWLLGYWLGNGFSKGRTVCTSSYKKNFDKDFVLEKVKSVNCAFTHTHKPEKGHTIVYVDDLTCQLNKYGLINNKHIPKEYLRGSITQRLSLLQGLMDSDGYINEGEKSKKSNTVEFCSTTKQLAEAVEELVHTLGERCTLIEGRATFNGKDCGPKYRVCWRPSLYNPFSLPRKADEFQKPESQGLRLRHRMISEVIPLEHNPETFCITVDSPNSMYLAGRGFIPTHNSRMLTEFVRKKAVSGQAKRIALVGRTAADARDVLINGQSGLKNIHPSWERPVYKANQRKVVWPNGAEAQHFCASEDTQALTKQGWKNYKDLKVGEKIRTLNVEKDVAEWQPVEKINVFDVEEEPIIFTEMNLHSSKVTLDHKWPVRNKEIKKIKWRESLIDFSVKDGIITAAEDKTFPEKKTYSDSFVALVGWYTSEGSIHNLKEQTKYDKCVNPEGYFSLINKRKDYLGWTHEQIGLRINWTPSQVVTAFKSPVLEKNRRKELAFALGIAESSINKFFEQRHLRTIGTISQNKDRLEYRKIKEHLCSLFGPPTKSLRDIRFPAWNEVYKNSDRKVGCFALNHEAMKEFLKVCEEKEKVVTFEFINKLTKRQLEIFCEAYEKGDGSTRKDGTGFTIIQKDNRRLDSLEYACILLGRTVRRSFRYHTLKSLYHPVLVKPSYKSAKRVIVESPDLWVTNSEQSKRVHPKHYMAGKLCDSRQIEYYTGKVWCPTTKNHTWMAKHNGTVFFTGNSSERPDQLRGPEHDLIIFDELAAFKNREEIFNNAMLGLRLGPHPQALIATTPRPINILRDLLQREGKDVLVRRGSTFDNADNLSDSFLKQIRDEYEGTSFERQEIYGELFDQVPGALWTRDMLDNNRVTPNYMGYAKPRMDKIIVGVDPSVGENGRAGIIVAGRIMEDNQAYIIQDRTRRGRPDEWATEAVKAFHDHNASYIVAEKNQGGEMVKSTLQAVDPYVPVKLVYAAQGKMPRAQPVSTRYEKGQVKHVGILPELEDEMCNFTGQASEESPDRLDACFVAGIKILTKDNPEKSIEDIQVGDEVFTRKGWKKVINCGLTGHKPVMRVVFDNGESLEGTKNHPIWAHGQGWVEMGEILCGQVVKVQNSQKIVCVMDVQCYENKIEPVYNLEVEDQPEYFANGVLVHNCVWALTDLIVKGGKIKWRVI